MLIWIFAENTVHFFGLITSQKTELILTSQETELTGFLQVFKKRLFSTYRIANPPLGKDDARDLELVYKPRADGSLDEFWDAR